VFFDFLQFLVLKRVRALLPAVQDTAVLFLLGFEIVDRVPDDLVERGDLDGPGEVGEVELRDQVVEFLDHRDVADAVNADLEEAALQELRLEAV
jgi:hypothetical protein